MDMYIHIAYSFIYIILHIAYSFILFHCRLSKWQRIAFGQIGWFRLRHGPVWPLFHLHHRYMIRLLLAVNEFWILVKLEKAIEQIKWASTYLLGYSLYYTASTHNIFVVLLYIISFVYSAVTWALNTKYSFPLKFVFYLAN